MSLAVLADHMASKGRGPDSMLIHMSPREVQGLQALAEHHGGTLTINPDTGLPEANFLEKLLPTIIGAGISYFSGGTIDPMTAAAMVGGVETARTGDLGKGISAGLGAYGGANLTAGLTEAGASTIGAAEAAKGVTMTPELLAEFADNGSKDVLLQQQVADRMAAATPYEKLSSGFDAFKNNPTGMAKSLAMPAAMAFGPAILAGANVQAKGPQTITKPGMIRPYSFDPYGGTYTAGTPYEAQVKKAAYGGLMGMAAGGIAGYGDGDDVPRQNGMAQGGMYDFAQRSEPVVRMAQGGIAEYAAGGYTQEQINAALAAELAARPNTPQASLTDYAKSQYGLTDAQINAAYDTLPGFNAQGKFDAADYMANSKPGVVDYQMTVDAANAANPYSAQNMAKVDVTRPGQYVTDPVTNQPVALSAYSPGFDINNPTALTYLGELASRGGQDSTSLAFNQIATPAQKAEATRLYGIEKARLEAIDRAAGRLPADNKGLAGLNQNQNLLTNQNLTNQNTNAGLAGLIPEGASRSYKWYAERGLGFDPIDKAIDNFFAEYTDDLALLPPDRQEKVMRDALVTEGMNEADVVKATGKTIAQLIQQKRNDGSIIVPGNLKDVPVGSLPGGVSGAGNTVVNANGTITTRPDIPGIPDDGFTGMKNVRDVYEAGGGNLGVNKALFAPTTTKQIEDRYKLTGGSKAAYEYLMGRAPYSPTPYTPTGEIMKPYFESVGRFPENRKAKKYVFVNGKYELNPDYVKPSYVLAGEKAAADKAAGEKTTKAGVDSGKSINVIDNEGRTEQATLRDDGFYYTSGGNKYDEKGAQVAAGGGLMAMARGGMPQQFNLGDYSDGGRLLRGPGDGVSDSIPATIGGKRPARLADGEFVVPARIVSELGNGSTEAGARKLYAMMDRIQKARRGTVGKGRVAKNSRSDKYLPA